jgi:hypothetical protein
VDALNLTHSPENGRDGVPAERIDLRASHASVHAKESDGRAPGGSDSIEPNHGRGAILACRDPLGHAVPEYEPATSQKRCRWGLCNGTGPGLAMKRRIPAEGIVKLLGMIGSPGNSRRFAGAISTDPTLRQPALSP